jgi:hypothetical protein
MKVRLMYLGLEFGSDTINFAAYHVTDILGSGFFRVGLNDERCNNRGVRDDRR